jgi:fructose-bisphosphate aldolase/2-amino-3,7-dideoxy-D-threo-hept-6-ulosonate synthase
MATNMGKQLRLGRLFDPDTKTSIVLPMDHGVEEAGYIELERPAGLVSQLASAGVNAFLMRRGLAAFSAGLIAGRAALRNGADAVVTTFFIGPDTEAVQVPQLGAIADECNELGLPLLAEIFPVGGPDASPYDGPYSISDMRLAVRVASEEGADFIKTWYPGDPESFQKIVDYSLVPVLIAGGPRAENLQEVLAMVGGAMDAGASGIAMGRKIWQSPDPAGMVRALSAIIRERAPVDDALGLLSVAADK